MSEVPQADLARAIRGGVVDDSSEIEPVVLGISSVARAAVRRVHRTSPHVARAYYSGKVAGYLSQGGSAAATARSYGDSIDQYILWDSQAGGWGADIRCDVPSKITFAPGDMVRAIGHIVLNAQPGEVEVRMLLWDELPFDQKAAEMLALPVLEAVDANYGAGATKLVHVWQLAQGQQAVVLPGAAQARFADVAGVLSRL